jgi:hypothetical protein
MMQVGGRYLNSPTTAQEQPQDGAT